MKENCIKFLDNCNNGTLSPDDREALSQLFDCLETHYPEFLVFHGDDFALYASDESEDRDGENA